VPDSTMKALCKPAPGPGASLVRVPVPEAGPGEVLIRVRAASICGTDLHIYNWDAWSAAHIRPPLIFGHEFCGTVETLGPGVNGLQPGQLVSAEMHISCGRCRPCRLGQSHVCQSLEILGIHRDGCFAEFLRVPASNVWPLDGQIPLRYAAVLDPLGNAVHTVLAGEVAGCSVVVTGCGPIGLMAIAVARAVGAALIVATEPNPYRRALAEAMGADLALDPAAEDPVPRVRQITDGGADVLLEMSGHPLAIQQGLAMLRPGGRASLLGIPREPVALDLYGLLIARGITLQGIFGRRMYQTWVEMTALLQSRRLNLDPLFGESLPLEEFEHAFSLLNQGRAQKILLFPGEVPA